MFALSCAMMIQSASRQRPHSWQFVAVEQSLDQAKLFFYLQLVALVAVDHLLRHRLFGRQKQVLLAMS
jgi:hypothetical protein